MKKNACIFGVFWVYLGFWVLSYYFAIFLGFMACSFTLMKSCHQFSWGTPKKYPGSAHYVTLVQEVLATLNCDCEGLALSLSSNTFSWYSFQKHMPDLFMGGGATIKKNIV